MRQHLYAGFICAAFGLVGALIAYGMSTTAKHDPQTVCLTRPWLDVKPPC